MTIKLSLRLPTTAYGYAELEIEGDTKEAVERDLASMQRTLGASIQITGGGDSATAAERLLKEELGAVRINEDGSPWDQPQAPVQQEWAGTPGPADPFSSPPVSDPFATPQADPFSAPPPGGGEYYVLDIPQNLRDDWSPKEADGSYSKTRGLMNTIQSSQPKGTIKWLADKKRWGIKRSAPQNIIDGLKQRGYKLD